MPLRLYTVCTGGCRLPGLPPMSFDLLCKEGPGSREELMNLAGLIPPFRLPHTHREQTSLLFFVVQSHRHSLPLSGLACRGLRVVGSCREL